MRVLYLILICFVAPVAAVVAWLRGLADMQRRERISDRFGRPSVRPTKPVFWIHAASMGEVQAAGVLVERLLKEFPRHSIVMTTMTTTGAARVRNNFRERVTHCFLPYDMPFAVRGFFDRVRPVAAVILETELWPNLLEECARRSIPVLIASARISPRTADRYRRFAALFRDGLRHCVVAAQTEEDAFRFKALGAGRISVVGNLKFDFVVADSVRQTGAELRRAVGGRFLWIAGSTHATEEKAALDAHRRLLEQAHGALLVIVPRHPDRFAEVREFLQRESVRFVTRSSQAPIASHVDVLLLDTMGELLACYAAADLAFVGGTLVPVGGHSLVEPSSLGLCTICGPFVGNTQEIFDRLKSSDAIVAVASASELGDAVLRLAKDEPGRKAIGIRAEQVIQGSRGTADRIVSLFKEMLVARDP